MGNNAVLCLDPGYGRWRGIRITLATSFHPITSSIVLIPATRFVLILTKTPGNPSPCGDCKSNSICPRICFIDVETDVDFP